MLGLLFAFFGVLFSLWGVMALFLGLIQFLLLPMIPRVTNQFHSFARLHSWLGTTILKRAAVVVTKQGDLLLKRSSPTGLGTETMSVDGEEKEIGDPASRQSTWHGIPFGLVEGVHAIFFDPRDAALGERKREYEEQSEMVVQATPSERDMYDVLGWVRGVFEFPKGKHELPNLAAVRDLISGSERGEHPGRVETFYENSRAPYDEGASTVRLILLMVALLGPFFGIWLMADQVGTPSDSVSFGMLWLLVSTPTALKNIDWKESATALAVILPLPLTFLFMVAITNAVFATFFFIIMGMGFWFIPILLLLMKPSDSVAESAGRTFLKTGLMGYDRPVWESAPDGYHVRDYDNLPDVEEERVTWHRFLGRVVGFTFTPEPRNWDNETVDRNEIDRLALADGGPATNIPPNCQRVPDRGRADIFADFVPRNRSRRNYYVSTGIAMRRIADAARGSRSHNRLLQAKEKHGNNSGMSDKSMMVAMSILGLLSFGLGVVFFFLL